MMASRRRCGARHLRALSLVAGLLVAACYPIWSTRAKDAISFSVNRHAGLMSDCRTCHAAVMDDLVPAEARRSHEQACLTCHGKEEQSCGTCHEGLPGFRPDKDRQLIFSHREHLPRVDQDCTRCHTPPGEGSIHPTGSPGHPQCFQCHAMRSFFDELKCAKCHVDLVERRLLPLENFQHTLDFDRVHGELLKDPQARVTCAQCHDDSFCADCHFEERFILPSELRGEDAAFRFIHPGDFIHRHPSLARTEPTTCVTCHSPNTCRECHQRNGVAPPEATERSDGFSFHPPGIADPTSPDFHGRAARRDILACASCHDSGLDANCVQCHQVGGVGGNPHPPGFRSRLSKTHADVCKACHK
ncbi:MAG: cytochrome c3 family protein [Planctomycetota bacterium]